MEMEQLLFFSGIWSLLCVFSHKFSFLKPIIYCPSAKWKCRLHAQIFFFKETALERVEARPFLEEGSMQLHTLHAQEADLSVYRVYAHYS